MPKRPKIFLAAAVYAVPTVVFMALLAAVWLPVSLVLSAADRIRFLKKPDR